MSNETPLPCWAASPGEYIADELRARSLTRDDMASGLGWSLERISGIIDNDHYYTNEEANQIGDYFGTSGSLWQRIQAARFYYLGAALSAFRAAGGGQ